MSDTGAVKTPRLDLVRLSTRQKLALIGKLRLHLRPAAVAEVEEARSWYESRRPGLGEPSSAS